MGMEDRRPKDGFNYRISLTTFMELSGTMTAETWTIVVMSGKDTFMVE